MRLISWENLPQEMKNERVLEYYRLLDKRRGSLFLKRLFDISAAIFTLIILFPLLLLISIAVKMDSKGPAIFRQKRITQYGRQFKILKFRTMVINADKAGTQVTVNKDSRVTKTGRILRRLRLDEIPQLLNIIAGDMTFVGTRPEVPGYVEKYSDEMLATLLMPAGVTSEASIEYKDEEVLISDAQDADRTYTDVVLKEKMRYNLKGLAEFSFFNDIKIMFRTVFAVMGRNKNKVKCCSRKNIGTM
ncbi:lipopolysaccharide/colanic/teichoic acid biosynthesis glycosyltransferase [Ruminiclostridium sufflavum DSM 19573]|uniref:Lipopolysaccharide/colanic/teichoic acid biosynthesis glycosyltransferase n=1 Tax=Ruminiclostridium sufflavum DSM 19573 TaxID=1121337 RepID=A0A318XMK1_9FIRM|nr:sugar transferase [Ruminiclostridium sufflavum]PYG87789.1 lipopolysaccharide/colanic/teichoic acid biosynthesis glycosyltransferase [Ruminiclostridium sufflavum DSM 19573]